MMYLRTGGWVRLWVAALILLIPTLAFAKTISVSAGDKNGISGALAGASAGDVILLGCGDYYEQALYIPDGVTLIGVDGDAECVRIVTTGGGTAVLVFMDVGSMTMVGNLTVVADSGGMGPVTRGAGAILSNASPTIFNVIFQDLEADYGGAVYCSEGSSPLFQVCRFENNYARAVGGAVACVGESVVEFNRCLFVDNTAEISGGAINAALGAAPFLSECTVVGSNGAVGSGLASWNTTGLIMDRVIMVDGVEGRGWDGDAPSAPAPTCTDLFGNEGGDWIGALEAHESINGNISAAPQFCGPADPGNPYTLNDTSPCSADANPGCGRMGAFDVNCSVVSNIPGDLPLVSRLHPNYPNPFNPRTTIKFDLKQSGPVDLAVFDVAGRLVKRLVREDVAAGIHETIWEGTDTGGRTAAAGVYFFRLKTRDTIDTKRMTLIK